jgi:hypothetical protein
VLRGEGRRVIGWLRVCVGYYWDWRKRSGPFFFSLFVHFYLIFIDWMGGGMVGCWREKMVVCLLWVVVAGDVVVIYNCQQLKHM